MSTKRLLVLILGPPLLIAASYWVAFELPSGVSAAATIESVSLSKDSLPAPRAHQPDNTSNNRDIDRESTAKAEALKQRLGGDIRFVSYAPYLVGGNIEEVELRQLFRKTIDPIVRAIRNSYLQTTPDRTVTILVLNDVDEYRRCAKQLDDYDAVRYHGYYVRDDDRIVLDISSGNGTLAHELTHALMAFDFPNAPEWFDEGLASLHEQCEFSPDEQNLIGTHNWRLLTITDAVQTKRLEPLEKLIRHGAFRGEGEGLHYAQVRYLCLYLQQRGLLRDFYHEFRASASSDPQGIAALCRALDVESLSLVDEDFRLWLRKEIHLAAKRING